MSLLDKAKEDLKRVTSKDFAIDVLFEDSAGNTATVKALASSHHLTIDPDTGLPVNVRNTHVSVHESNMTDAGLIVRDGNGEVNLINTYVTFENSAGQSKKFKINETYPDETLGLIVCILGDFE